MNQENLSHERKRILYRANHRGIKEMDIMLGGFATRNIATLEEAALEQFRILLEEHDRDLIQWFTGEKELPEHLSLELFERIISDHQDTL